jgi:hypothetical protein
MAKAKIDSTLPPSIQAITAKSAEPSFGADVMIIRLSAKASGVAPVPLS